jgi:short-subunit dehydrogenase
MGSRKFLQLTSFRAKSQKISVDVICPKTIRNKYSQVFNTAVGIDPIAVANTIVKTIQKPTNSNIFIPKSFYLLHFVERIFPSVFDILFGLKHHRSKTYRSLKINSILITGASSGLGKELALLYSKTCRRLYLVARSQKALKLLKKDIQHSTNCQVKILPLDLSQENNLKKLIKHLGSVDLLINNAGSHLSGTIADTPIKISQKIFALNFFCPVFLISKLLSRSKPVKKIINILSTTAIVGRAKLSAYSSSKSALWCFSRVVKRSFGNSTEVIEVIPATFQSSLFQKGIDLDHYQSQTTQKAHARILSSARVAKIIFNSEKQLKDSIFIPPLEAKIYLLLEALFPKLFRKIFR